jgi:hypothetical protein
VVAIFLIVIAVTVSLALVLPLPQPTAPGPTTPVPTHSPVPTLSPAPTNSPTSAPTLSPEAFLSDLLSSISFYDGVALSTPSSPQSMAFNWLVTNHTNLLTLSPEQIIQRYALATLYYSTNGDSWNNRERIFGWMVVMSVAGGTILISYSLARLMTQFPLSIFVRTT